jgi:hypothetical protein
VLTDNLHVNLRSDKGYKVFIQVIKSSKGALDLASVMIGVLVIGVIGGLISAFVFAVIPWTQDKTAVSQLNAVIDSQQAYAGFSAESNNNMSLSQAVAPAATSDPVVMHFGTLKDLVDKGVLNVKVAEGSDTVSHDGNLCVVAVTDTTFRAEVKSVTGALFFATQSSTVKPMKAEESVCIPDPGTGLAPGSVAKPPTPTATTPVATPDPTLTQNPGSGVLDGNETKAVYYWEAGPYWTEATTLKGSKTIVMVADSLQITTESSTPVDWEIKLDRKTAPFISVPAGQVTVLSGLPSWASVKSDENFITIYNNAKFAQVKKGSPQNIGALRFNFVPPSYKASEMNNTGPQGIGAAGTNIVQANMQVSLKNAAEGRYGFWETDVDVTNMSRELGQNGSAYLESTWASQGFSLTKKSGNIYTLKYSPQNDHAFMLKGKDSTHQNLGSTTPTFTSILRFQGDGKVMATLTAGTVKGNEWYATQTFQISTPKAGSWSNEVNLKELRDLNRNRTPVVNHSSFTLTPKAGDQTGDLFILTFKDSYQIGSVDIQI